MPVTDVSLLLLPYHGRGGKTGVHFLEQMNPDQVVVTATKPNKKYLNFLEEHDIPWSSNLQKDLSFLSDGKHLKYN